MNRPGQISKPVLWVAGITSTLVLVALGLRQWIDTHRDKLPLPRSEEGRALTFSYNIASHAVFVAAIALLVSVPLQPLLRD